MMKRAGVNTLEMSAKTRNKSRPMKIHIDRSIYTAEHANFSGILKENQERIPGAFRVNNEVFLQPQPLLLGFLHFFHEVGHVMGDHLSFRRDVLSIPEVSQTYVELDDIEVAHLNELLSHKNPVALDEITYSIARKIIYGLSRGNFDPEDHIILHQLTEKQFVSRLKELIQIYRGSTLQEIGGKIVLVNSKKGRTVELSAIFAEICCLLILENTVQAYLPNSTLAQEFNFSGKFTANRQRALNIIGRAFDRGLTIPSMKDLGN